MLAASGYELLKFNPFLPSQRGMTYCSNLSTCAREGKVRLAVPFVLSSLPLIRVLILE